MEIKYYDLSAAQQLLFYSQKYTLHRQVNNVCTSVLTDNVLDFDILKKAIVKACERNDSFRIRIVKQGGEMKQYFDKHRDPPMAYLDFRGRTQQQMDKALYKIAHRRISVYGKQMYKIYLLDSCDNNRGIYFVVSHMLMDFWGITVFYKDIFTIYDALVKGNELPKPLYPYEKLLTDELRHKNTIQYVKDRNFWIEQFNDNEPIFTHVNGRGILDQYRARHKNPNLRNAQAFSLRTKADNVMFPFPADLVEQMSNYCLKQAVPVLSVIMLAFRSYFSKVNNREKDISLNTIIARRGLLKEKNTGGTRVHFMPFRTIFEEDTTFTEACRIIAEKHTAVYRHAEIDPVEVVNLWKRAYNLSPLGEYTTGTLSFQPVHLDVSGELNIRTRWYGNGALGAPLFITVMDGDNMGGYKFHYEYQPHVIKYETVKRLHSYFLNAIKAGISSDGLTIGNMLDID